MSKVEHLTDANFEEKVLKADKPVLVDFFATWCGPCRMIAPAVEALAEDMEGQVYIYKVDVDECPGVAQQYGIMSIPTLITFKNGETVDKTVGLTQKNKIENMLNKLL